MKQAPRIVLLSFNVGWCALFRYVFLSVSFLVHSASAQIALEIKEWFAPPLHESQFLARDSGEAINVGRPEMENSCPGRAQRVLR